MQNPGVEESRRIHSFIPTFSETFSSAQALRTGSESTEANKAVSLASVDAAVDPYMSQPERVVGVVHQKVLEAFWDGPDTFPTRIVCDDVLN